jgi:hypothetical protein
MSIETHSLDEVAAPAAVFYFALTPTLAKATNAEAAFQLITQPEDGELVIHGAHDDKYLLRCVEGKLSLTFPERDYSGDPAVVDGFNTVVAEDS